MPWYGTLLIGLVCGGLVVALVWFLVRRRGGSDGAEAKAKLEEERAKREALEAELETQSKLAKEAKDLAQRMKKVTAWYNEQKALIAKRARDEFTNLVEDPEALDAKLDRLLDLTPVVTIPTRPDPEGEG